MKRLVVFLILSLAFLSVLADSGGDPSRNTYGINAVSGIDSVIDTMNTGRTLSNGVEFDGRQFFIINNESARMYKMDYIYGLIDSFAMPVAGYHMGIGIVNDILYVSNLTTGNIDKMTKAGVSVTSIASPGGTGARGVTSDGIHLYIATTDGFICVTDTLMNIIDTIHISSVIGWPMDMAFCSEDSTLWVLDDVTQFVKKLDISIDPPVVLDSIAVLNGATNTGEGVAFDGNDIWISTYTDPQIFRYDVGYAKTRVAYFEDHAPWGSWANEDVLCRNRVAYHYFSVLDLPTMDLSKFQKAIFASQQELSFYQAIADNRTKIETWISSGGIFQLNGATFSSDAWDGLVMPGGFSMTFQQIDTATIVSAWHPLLNEPVTMDSSMLVDWGTVFHGRLTGLPADAYNILLTGDSLNPSLSVFRMGKGGVIATTLTAEYAFDNALSEIIENIDMYWLYGCSPNVLWAVAEPNSPVMIKEIEEYPDFGNIDYMDAGIFIPNQQDMSLYDVILTYPDYPYADPESIGDSLFEHVANGKWVITCGWSWFTTGHYLGGEIMKNTYNPFSPLDGNNHFSTANLGAFVAGHEFMNNVSSLSSYYRDYLVLNSGADTVARWDDDEWLLGYRNLPGILGGIVGLNIVPTDQYVISGELGGDYIQLLHNVLLVSELTPVEEVALDGKTNAFKTEITSITSGIFKASFSQPVTEPVKLSVYDKTGREISVKTFFKSSGIKEASFDAKKTGISSGVYFFKIESGKNLVSGKFLYISK
ncbi:MAG: hypothetical protein AB7T10_00740 [bacterium]